MLLPHELSVEDMPENAARLDETWQAGCEDSSTMAESLLPDGYVCNEALAAARCFWPLDLLPDDIPNARICTYAYKSKWTSSEFKTTLDPGSKSSHLLTVHGTDLVFFAVVHDHGELLQRGFEI